MKKKNVTCIIVALLVCIVPTSLWAWCWIRDTDLSEDNCPTGSYQQNCCDGELRKWLDGNMTFHISTSTDSNLIPYIEAGMDKWNVVEMSDFRFDWETDSAKTVIDLGDEENTIVIDPDFCTNYAPYVGSSCSLILGISGTSTPAAGSGEPFQAKESDIALNDESYDWDDGTSEQNTVAIIAHEAGHSAGLTHPGDECRPSGSSGCGAEFPEATMYYAYDVSNVSDEPNIDKATLELDDIAAMVYGYPKSTLRVRVLTNEAFPQRIFGAKVDLLDSAAPVNGSSIAEGGSVYGDVTNPAVLFGDGSYSPTYVNASPFNDTDANGETNDINPIHENLRVRVTAGSLTPVIQPHTVVPDANTVIVTIDTTETDFAGPTLVVTSHTNGQAVGTANITLAGTASDSGRGDSGVSQVTINGAVADNGTASLGGVANWSRDITLAEGSNTLTIVAYDNQSSEPNTSSLTFLITYDTTPPTVSSVSPANGATGVDTSANFGVAFSEAINPSTINTSTFVVDNGVTGIVTYSAGNHSAMFVPSAPLANNTTYTARLTTGIQDTVGLPMTADYTWSISTGAPAGGSGDGGGGSGCFVGTVASRQAQ